MPDRREITVEEVHRYVLDHAKTISEHNNAIRGLLDHQHQVTAAFDLDKAVRVERAEAVNSRMDRIEASIKAAREECNNDIKELTAQRDKFQGRIWVVILAIISSFIAAVSKWLFGGGLAPPA